MLHVGVDAVPAVQQQQLFFLLRDLETAMSSRQWVAVGMGGRGFVLVAAVTESTARRGASVRNVPLVRQ